MLSRLFSFKPNIDEFTDNGLDDNLKTILYAKALLGKDLLKLKGRPEKLKQIKRLLSITEDVWNNHYLYAIEQFSEIVQEIPASEIHHHSEEGGLIDHTLEVLHIGLRVSQGYVLPPNAEPEEIVSSSDRWRFGIFLSILSHDIGKVVTDIEVVYSNRGRKFTRWYPWVCNLPLGSEYTYRYKHKIKNSRISKSLHEKAAMSLLPKLLTPKATEWIFDDTELLAQILSTVNHSISGGQVISEIVRKSDSASVAKNLGANTGINIQHSYAVPLHEKIMVSLRNLINDGDLKRNKPGAAVWVTENETWVVSKAAIEAVKAQLMNEGHKGIPKNVVRIFEVLNDHEVLIKNPDGDSVWTAEVSDYAKNWQQKLTFLRFKNEVIWPNSHPDLFDGKITPLTPDGKPINEILAKTTDSIEIDPSSSSPNSNNTDEKAIPPKKTIQSAPVLKNKLNANKSSKQENVPIIESVNSIQAKNLWKNTRKVQEKTLLEDNFIAWLLSGINRKKIRVNEKKAPVHVLEKHIAIVTPAIFIQYLDNNSLKKRIYEKRAGDKKIYTLLQRELESLDIHQRSLNGQNIVRLLVDGERKQAELNVYLLNRECFPSLNNFSSNKVMKIEL